MSHLIDMSNNRANIAYVGEKPWHSYGEKLGHDASKDEWRIEAGLNWEAVKRPIFHGVIENGRKVAREIDNLMAVVRSDTQTALGVVSGNRYKIVQPKEALSFIWDYVEKFGFTMETAGCLDGGKRLWALAKTPLNFRIHGTDLMEGYVLFSTSFDGKSATKVMFTTVRVVCWNTLSYAFSSDNGSSSVSVSHSKEFDADDVNTQLGIYKGAWASFEEDANLLADTKLTTDLNFEFFNQFLGEENVTKSLEKLKKGQKSTLSKITGLAVRGKGQDLSSAKGTLWGLVNGVTEYYDHKVTKNKEKRLNSAYFDSGAKRKTAAFKIALDLAKDAA